MSEIISDNCMPAIDYFRLILNDEVNDCSSIQSKSNPDTVFVCQDNSIGVIRHRVNIYIRIIAIRSRIK